MPNSVLNVSAGSLTKFGGPIRPGVLGFGSSEDSRVGVTLTGGGSLLDHTSLPQPGVSMCSGGTLETLLESVSGGEEENVATFTVIVKEYTSGGAYPFTVQVKEYSTPLRTRVLNQSWPVNLLLNRRTLSQEYEILSPVLTVRNTRKLDQQYSQDSVGLRQRRLNQQYSQNSVSLRIRVQVQQYSVRQLTMFLNCKWATIDKTFIEDFQTLVNTARAGLGLPPYAIYQGLGEYIARSHASNMVATGIFAHDDLGFPVGYMTFLLRSARIRERPSDCGETISLAGVSDPDSYFPASMPYNGWWDSPSHHATMMKDWGTSNIAFMLDVQPYGTYSGFPEYGPDQLRWTVGVYMNMDSGEIEVIETYLNQNWQVLTPVIEGLSQVWGVSAYTHNTGQLAIPYNVEVASQIGVVYGAEIAGVLGISLGFEVSGVFGWTNEFTTLIQGGWAIQYDLEDMTEVKGLIGFSEVLEVAGFLETYYGDASMVAGMLEVSCQSSDAVSGWIGVEYQLVELEAGLLGISYGDYQFVGGQLGFQYDLRVTTEVMGRVAWVYSVQDEALVIELGDYYIMKGGVRWEIDSPQVVGDEEISYWEAEFFAEYGLVGNLKTGDEILLSFFGETYVLTVTSYSKSMRSDGVLPTVKVRARSKLGTLGEGFSTTKVSRTNDGQVMASELLQSIIGMSVIWEIDDWMIKALRFSVSDSFPLEAAQLIAEAAGAMLISNRDGSVRLRKFSKVGTNKYKEGVQDHILSDMDDNLEFNEGFLMGDGTNKYRIRDSGSSYSDRFEWVPEEGIPTEGVLKFYPSPWRTEFTIEVDSLVPVNFSTGKLVTEEKTEEIRFENGTGNLSYPITTLSQVVWVTQSLGSVTFSEGGVNLQVPTDNFGGYGIAEVTYFTRYFQYNVSGLINTKFLVLAEEK